MTEEKMNAAIAEACGFVGWEGSQPHKNGPKFWFWDYPKNWTGPSREPWVPRFCTDLNAIHQAEQLLWRRDYTLRQRFIEKLAAMLNKSEWRKMEAVDMLDLTARERAEAFLRTLGKWEEEQK